MLKESILPYVKLKILLVYCNRKLWVHIKQPPTLGHFPLTFASFHISYFTVRTQAIWQQAVGLVVSNPEDISSDCLLITSAGEAAGLRGDSSLGKTAAMLPSPVQALWKAMLERQDTGFKEKTEELLTVHVCGESYMSLYFSRSLSIIYSNSKAKKPLTRNHGISVRIRVSIWSDALNGLERVVIHCI